MITCSLFVEGKPDKALVECLLKYHRRLPSGERIMTEPAVDVVRYRLPSHQRSWAGHARYEFTRSTVSV